jgi:NifU-like protein involved in Fe-S cluster formation
MSLPYSKTVLEHFRHPRNVGELEQPDAVATEGSPACGDMVKLSLKVNPRTLVIEDVKFRSYGCASNIATGSIITELAKGKTLDQAKKITWEQAADELGGLPPVKVHCAVLAVDSLKTAIENYEHQHGLVKDPTPTDAGLVRQRLKRVINPLTGLDVLTTKLVPRFDVDGGVITVGVDLSPDHPFAPAIRQEIEERLEPLWDVREVRVCFEEDREDTE